jgi:serine/threonine protein kinase
MVTIDPDPAILGGCKGVTMVSEFAGQYSIEKVKGDVSQLKLATARVIEILRDIHSHGIVHGDIHLGNIRIGDLADVDTSTKIIDFGRAELYVLPKFTDTGAFERWVHLPRKKEVLSRNYCPTLLSVFELRGSPPARRDDMYRLAESIAFALDMNDWKKMYAKRNEVSVVLEMKMGLRIPTQPLFEEFLVEMRNLPFKARPDYEKWIRLFRS